ncbi:rhamnosyltransferase WsaF family glycosyltransferase [Frigidibacter sp. MR17.24]|uniref:rhamnosyltransferase WsaF family glycosyltransferase n=1 Tax=Frigidibacter sp. MR17.24 TaxID=3127345 RepID=UPI003012F215
MQVRVDRDVAKPDMAPPTRTEEREALERAFDARFYLWQLGGMVPASGLEHYLREGWKLGLDPAPNFCTRSYLAMNDDVRDAGKNPFEHWVLFGRAEKRARRPSSRLDPAVRMLAGQGELDFETAQLVARGYRAVRPAHGAPTRRGPALKDYLGGAWRARVALPGAAIGESGPGPDGAASYDAAERAALLAAMHRRGHGPERVALIGELADPDWYAGRCAAIGLPGPAALGCDIASHYLALGRYFALSVTPLFDPGAYLDAALARGLDRIWPCDALIHYLEIGEALGLRPCCFFNPAQYRARHMSAPGSALRHYVREGAAAGYDPSPAFPAAWYRRTHGVSAPDALAHFCTLGMAEGRAPHPLLDVDWYRARHRLATAADAVRHYVSKGFAQDLDPHPLVSTRFIAAQLPAGRTGDTAVERYFDRAATVDPHPLFSSAYYLSQGAAVAQPLVDYLGSAGREGGARRPRPNPYFDDDSYYAARPDVRGSAIPPLYHYAVAGGFEKNIAVHPLIDHRVLMDSLGELRGRTPLELLMTGEAGARARVRRLSAECDTQNRSRWQPVALEIDAAAPALPPLPPEGPAVAVLAHVFYTDLLPEVIALMANMPGRCRLLVSTDTAGKRHEILAALARAGIADAEVRVFENRGRDIAPSLLGFLDRLEGVDYALHVHTKRSRHYGQSFDRWRRYLFEENAGSPARVDAILRQFQAEPALGALAPVDFGPIRKLISWGHDRAMVEGLMTLAGRPGSLREVSLEFPSGSMFWFRVAALGALARAGLRHHHFDPEEGQVDGTLAHAIERALFLLAEVEGFDWARFCSGERLGGYAVTRELRFARSRLLSPQAAAEPVAASLPETRPFFCRAVDNPRPRLNLLIPTADLQRGYAGVSEAIRQFRAIGARLGAGGDLRIIATDVPFTNMTLSPEGFATVDSLADEGDMIVAPGFLRDTQPLSLRRGDRFVASAWWTARQGFALLDEQARLFGGDDRRRLVYLIQDFEPGFYAWSTRYALAESTYRHPDRTIAVFNTPLLAGFMQARYAFPAAATYRPMINEALLIPGAARLPPAARERIVLLYARPHAERNCLEMIDAIVFACRRQDPAFWADWRFCAIGEDFLPGAMRSDAEILGRLSLGAYRDLLGRARLGISIMVSPHPSYPPLEMAANGVRVLTNRYEGKDLSTLHGNIESFDLYDPAALADRLRAMATAGGEAGRPKVDWFFEGGNNLDEVARQVAAALAADPVLPPADR